MVVYSIVFTIKKPNPQSIVKPKNKRNFAVLPFSKFNIDKAIVNELPISMNVFNKANPLLSSPAECENNSKLEFLSTINAPKKPTNLSVNSDLLYEAKALKLNLSATFEAALLNELKAARRDKWIAENKQAIDTCNKLANEHRLFADKHREF